MGTKEKTQMRIKTKENRHNFKTTQENRSVHGTCHKISELAYLSILSYQTSFFYAENISENDGMTPRVVAYF